MAAAHSASDKALNSADLTDPWGIFHPSNSWDGIPKPDPDMCLISRNDPQFQGEDFFTHNTGLSSSCHAQAISHIPAEAIESEKTPGPRHFVKNVFSWSSLARALARFREMMRFSAVDPVAKRVVCALRARSIGIARNKSPLRKEWKPICLFYVAFAGWFILPCASQESDKLRDHR